MENNNELNGFSAVKVKFDLKTIHSQLNSPPEAMTRPIRHRCEFLFLTIRSLNIRTLLTFCVTNVLLLN